MSAPQELHRAWNTLIIPRSLFSGKQQKGRSRQVSSESRHGTIVSAGTKGTLLQRHHLGTWMVPVPRIPGILQGYLMMQHIFPDWCSAAQCIPGCYLSPLWDSHQHTAEIAAVNIAAEIWEMDLGFGCRNASPLQQEEIQKPKKPKQHHSTA